MPGQRQERAMDHIVLMKSQSMEAYGTYPSHCGHFNRRPNDRRYAVWQCKAGELNMCIDHRIRPSPSSILSII